MMKCLNFGILIDITFSDKNSSDKKFVEQKFSSYIRSFINFCQFLDDLVLPHLTKNRYTNIFVRQYFVTKLNFLWFCLTNFCPKTISPCKEIRCHKRPQVLQDALHHDSTILKRLAVGNINKSVVQWCIMVYSLLLS